MNLKGIVLSKISQTKKDKCHMISLICEIKKNKISKQAEQKQSHRYRGYFDGCLMGGALGGLVKGLRSTHL